jgi:hypothetical protein
VAGFASNRDAHLHRCVKRDVPRPLEHSASSTGLQANGRRRESKPEDFVAKGRETSLNVASDEHEATFHDETRRAIAKTPTARAACIAFLAEQIAVFASSGDLGARAIAIAIAIDAISQLLDVSGTKGSPELRRRAGRLRSRKVVGAIVQV